MDGRADRRTDSVIPIFKGDIMLPINSRRQNSCLRLTESLLNRCKCNISYPCVHL